jgi:hypothetical protein
VGYFALALRLTLAAVCLVAAVGKLGGRRSVRAFARMLTDVGVPPRAVPTVGGFVVGAEFAVAALVPWRPTALPGSLLAVGLFAVLTAGTGRAVSRGSTATCRCFGGRGRRLGRDHVVRNAVLTAAAVAAAATARGAVPGAHPVGFAGAVAAAALSTLMVVYWDDIVGPALSRKGQP